MFSTALKRHGYLCHQIIAATLHEMWHDVSVTLGLLLRVGILRLNFIMVQIM